MLLSRATYVSMHIHQEQAGAHCLAQGHFSVWTGGAADQSIVDFGTFTALLRIIVLSGIGTR